MITIKSDLPSRRDSNERPYTSMKEALSMIHHHLTSLKESINSTDNKLYERAYNGLSFLSEELDIKNIFSRRNSEINNLDFLYTLAFCWSDFNIVNNQSNKEASSRQLTERLNIEDVGIRALAKYEIVNTHFFKGQTHYSIFNWDIPRLQKSLREIMKEEGKIPDRSYKAN